MSESMEGFNDMPVIVPLQKEEQKHESEKDLDQLHEEAGKLIKTIKEITVKIKPFIEGK